MTWVLYILYIIIAVLLLIGLSYYLNNIGIGMFQKIIIIMVLLILEIIFGILMYNGGIITKNISYPPIANICPDYWQYQNNLCLIPNNNKNIGSFSINNKIPAGYNNDYKGIDFTNSGWQTIGTNSFCSKQKWANINNIVWDGITNIDGGC
jgi:hypothetical protein